MGSGTTLVEAKLLNRHAVGVDINPFQYLKQIYNSNVNPNQKYLHEMVMLQICILLKIVELTLFVRIHHMQISLNTVKG